MDEPARLPGVRQEIDGALFSVEDDEGAVDARQLLRREVSFRPARRGVGERIEPHVHIVFVFEAVLHDFKLQLADGADDERLHDVRLFVDLDGAFLGELGDAAEELFPLHGGNGREAGEEFRREDGEIRIRARIFLVADRVAHAELARVEKADDVARIGFLHDGALRREKLLRHGELDHLAALPMQHRESFFKNAGADAHEGDAVVMLGIHIRLDFENETGKRGVLRAAAAFLRRSFLRRRGKLQKFFQKRLDAEICHGRAEEHRREFPSGDFLRIERIARFVQEFQIVQKRLAFFFREARGNRVVGEFPGNDIQFLRAVRRVADEEMARLRLAVVNAGVIAVDADGPIHRAGANAEHVLDIGHEVERIFSEMIDLVYEGENGNAAVGANFEKFLRLRFHALGDVDDHDGAVDGDERAVRVFRKIGVARRVQNIDAAAVVIELQDGARDGDAALLFNLHPVRDGVARGLSGFDGAGEMNGPAVEEQFFRERRLAGIRVRDDGKCAATRNFFRDSHKNSFPLSF